MVPIFQRALAQYRWQVLGWGGILLLLGLITIPTYDVVLKNPDPIRKMVEQFPPELLAMFARMDQVPDLKKWDPADPAVFLDMNYFAFMPLILGVFAVLAGSGLLVADEETGTLDLVLAHPVRRTSLFIGRVAAFVVATLGVLALAWLGIVLPMSGSSVPLSWAKTLLPFLSLLGVLLFYGTLAVLLSMLLPARRLAAMAAGMLLVASYFITALAQINSGLKPIAWFSPLEYYQSGHAIRGLKLTWLVRLLAPAALFAILAAWRFEWRDIRVAGEGSWRWPWHKRKPAG
jgi:beta-exotoxin I transport system permease protein